MGSVKQTPELVKETEWSRQYLIAPKTTFYESKFDSDDLQIKAEDIINRWEGFGRSERLDFAQALAHNCKTTFSVEEEKILRFLMEAGDEKIWATIALALCRHSDRELVIRFIVNRIEKSPPVEQTIIMRRR